jgi:Fe-S cluster assembly scaffold protein SufB
MRWKGVLDKKMQTFSLSETTSITLKESGQYTVELLKPGVHATINGRFLTLEKNQIDIELYIIHKAPHTSAQTMLKGVAKDNSHIRFFGRIKIEPNCPDTQSFLEERILLLSDKAKAEAIPELEILSDDVKCSHAASISRIPEEHLFYLQSRGIAQKDAEDLVVEGFLEQEEKADKS